MMHWKATLLVLALFSAALVGSGCSQPCCVRDYDEILQRQGLPSDLPSNPNIANMRLTPDSAAPSTVDDPDLPPVYITLNECVSMSLERGSIGTQSLTRLFTFNTNLNNLFNTVDDLGQYQSGFGLNGTDSVRVFSLLPSISETDIESSLARYDVVLRGILGANTKDQNPLGPNSFSSGQFGAFGLTAAKALPTGGEAEITWGSPTNAGSNPGTNFYNNFATRNFFSGSINPSYTPNLSLGFTQPLLRGYGTYINSILPQHPLSPAQQYPGSSAAAAPGIVIARINFDQSRAEFERVVNYMVLNVEASYFQLYALYVNLYSNEQLLKQAHATWKISKAKYEAGAIPNTQYANTRVQYEDARAKRLLALNKVLEQERELRMLCGLPMVDGKRLVPVDTPTVQEYVPNWESGYQEAMTLRPELAIARQDIKRRQAELTLQNNNLLPDVRLEANYNIHSFGTRLDGDGSFANGQTDNAFRDMIGMHFADYNLGITASMPLGYRAQYAGLRAAKLRLAQAYLTLGEQEIKARNNLAVAYRSIKADYDTIGARREQRKAAAEQVEGRFKEFVAGKITVDFLLTAQQQWADALAQEYQAIANYNLDIVIWQFAKGTLLRHNGIQIAEGPLPQCVQVRAVENERQRAAAIVCRERAEYVPQTGPCGLPDMPMAGSTVPSLPTMNMDRSDRIPDEMKQPLPMPSGPLAPGAQGPAMSGFAPSTTVTVTASPAAFSSPPVLSMPTTPGTIPMPTRQMNMLTTPVVDGK